MKKKFKCKDEVIYRCLVEYGNPIWTYGIFSHYYEQKDGITYAKITGEIGIDIAKWEILPYEGNEHLVGTTDSPDEEVRLEEGDCVMAKTDNGNWVVAQYKEHSELPWNNIEVVFSNKNHVYVDYVVRFSDFNPNDMEATKAKILCAKNGKIIRYKG